jgi:hypothetical protein
MTATESSSAAARSQETTPTAWASSGFAEQHEDTDLSDDSGGKHRHTKEGLGDHSDDWNGGNDDDIEGYLEPSDDVPLKGPLMIKNIPAQDEIFWAKVNQRLDPISRGQDALPRVLQSPDLDGAQIPLGVDQSQSIVGEKPDVTSAIVEIEDEDGEGKASVEPDVPLKFKSTFNFGAPFGIA